MRGENKIQCMDCPTGTYSKSHSGEVTLVKMWSLLENGLYVAQLAALFFRYTTQKPRSNIPLKIPIKQSLQVLPTKDQIYITLWQIQGQLVGFDLTPKFKLLLFKTGRQQQKPSKNYIMQKFAGFQQGKDFDFSLRMWKLHFWESKPHTPLAVIQQSCFQPS